MSDKDLHGTNKGSRDIDKELRETEKKVLEVYQKANPSTYNIEEDEDEFRKNERFANRLYTHSLKILPQVFNGSKLLEFGSGTGERSLNYLKWGADCTFVEMNEKAIERARKLCKAHAPDASCRFVPKSLFDFDSDELFDIAISNGVIHHTADKERAFAHQVSFLRPGGINVLGIGNTGGCIQRNLQRLIVYTFAGRDEEKIEQVAESLFKEHLDRAEKFGGRARKSIIYDTYVNPKLDFVSVAELLEWYKKYNLTFYTSWPPVVPPVLADDLSGLTDWREFPELLSRPEWIWGTQITDDASLCRELENASERRSSSFRRLAGKINDVQAEELNVAPMRADLEDVIEAHFSTPDYSVEKLRNFKAWLLELDEILRALEEEDFEEISRILKESSLFFRGKGGIGLTYFAAIKEEN